MNKESFSFVVYMIHACANKWNMMPSEVYQKLQSVGCIQCYFVPHYDILHTQGTSYIVDDIKRYLEVRGGGYSILILRCLYKFCVKQSGNCLLRVED